MLRIHTPGPPLSTYIQLFWTWDNYAPSHATERILPLGSMELNFNLSQDSYLVRYPQHNSRTYATGHAMVSGPRSEYFLIDTSRPSTLISVCFKPGGALPLFGIPASEFLNLHIPLSDLWGSVADDLFHSIAQSPNAQTRFHVLEKFLNARLDLTRPRHRAVQFALNHLSCGYYDQSHLVNSFRRFAGISPTAYLPQDKHHPNNLAAG